MKKLFTLLLFFAATSLCILSQVSHGGLPYSFENQWSTEVATKVMPTVDVEQMKLIDEEYYMEKGRSIRFGEEMRVAYNLSNSGEWKVLPNNDRVWRLKISSPGALHINLIYDDFFMPNGAKFFLYNSSKSEVLGEFNAGNNKSYGTFSTGFVRGSETILEYYEPAAVHGEGRLSVSTVVHAYRNMMGDLAKGYGDSGSCNINTNCPEADEWSTIKRSVVRIVEGGFDHCSGAMINNVRQDCSPLMLTAEHCSGSESDWLLYFNYESPGCDNMNGALTQSVSGVERVSGLMNGDFEIALLSIEPPIDYFAYYAGWNANNTPSAQTTCIHHPAGDIKKISFNTDPLVSSTFYGTPNTHWEVTEWENGTTEGGSSGAPLFDENQLIVGMLSGGTASCVDISGWDVFGKMSYGWNQGNNSASRLRDWLDPDNTGTTIVAGRSCAFDFNAALDIKAPVGEFCELSITPRLSFANQGVNPLNVLAVEYFVDNNPPKTNVWSGSLTPGESTEFELDSFVGLEGAHTFTACINNFNGMTSDDNAEDNCKTVSFSCADLPLGIGDDALLEFSAYPNPAANTLYVNLGELSASQTTIALTDLSGREVLRIESSTDQNVIDLPPTLSNGTYLLSVRNGYLRNTQKINILR